jgi:hypothetical protein
MTPYDQDADLEAGPSVVIWVESPPRRWIGRPMLWLGNRVRWLGDKLCRWAAPISSPTVTIIDDFGPNEPN